MTTMLTPTGEQAAILSAVKDTKTSLMITAYAGTGKTTTLTMIAKALPTAPSLALAFNVNAKKALEERFPPFFTVKTLNGLGHGAWCSAIRGKTVKLDDRKLGRLVSKAFKAEGFESTEEQWTGVRELVALAMQRGLVPDGYPNQGLMKDTMDNWGGLADEMWTDLGETEIKFARDVLLMSVKESFEGTISFDDQIYMPTMFNGVWPRFQLVMVDEAQDLSPLNHIMVQRVSAGRLIVVGDPKQAIYAFRGADSSSMGKIKRLRSEWIELPLATTFRCPKIVVTRQQGHAPGFRAHESNHEGGYARVIGPLEHDTGDMNVLHPLMKRKAGHKVKRDAGEMPSWCWGKDVEPLVGHRNAAVLCRNNAPLLGLGFKLLIEGQPIMMLGGEIGKQLVALSKKILPDEAMGASDCVHEINAWRESETALARANGKESKVSGIHDRADCLIAVIESGKAKDAKQVRDFLAKLFARTSGQITLSSGHKSKGLEWDVVLHLDPWRVPSKHALEDPVQMEQERNLKYVMETRAKVVLLEANLSDYVGED